MDHRAAADSGYLFDTKSGQNVRMPPPPLAAGDEIVNQACTVTVDADGNSRLIYLLTTKTPSHGLTPESQRTELVSFDPAKSSPLARTTFPLDVGLPWSLYPATGAFVATVENERSNVYAFFDPDTLQLRANPQPSEDNPLIAANFDGYATFPSVVYSTEPGVGYRSKDIHFFDGSRGTDIGVFHNVDTFITTEHGFFLQHNKNAKGADPADLQGGVFYYDMRSKDITGPVAPYLDTDGKSWTDPTEALEYTYGDSILLMGGDSSRGKYLKVFDMTAKRETFSLGPEQIDGLKIKDAYLAGAYVYLDNESDHPVIDITTKQPAHSGWSLRPVYQLSDGWVWVVPGDFGNTHSTAANGLCSNTYRLTCSRGGDTSEHGEYLARAANGPYAGPWY